MIHMSHHNLMKAELVNARFWDLIKLRSPWLLIGLIGAMFASLIVSKFELSLKENIALAFFIPMIAYMSDAIGTQTETVFIRALTDLKFNITKYIIREIFLGATLGSIFGVFTGLVVFVVTGSVQVGEVVAISLFLTMSVATGLACLTPIILRSLKQDPAVGSGPFTTALQYVVSLAVYFLVALIIL